MYAIFVSLFVFFNIFAINMWLQYRRLGRWRSYLFGEKTYIVLSLVAKSAARLAGLRRHPGRLMDGRAAADADLMATPDVVDARRAFTLHEAAERLGVHYMTVYRRVRLGVLPARKVDGSWWVDPADLAARRPTPAGPAGAGPQDHRDRATWRAPSERSSTGW